MARIRSIKPDFWTDEKLTECSMAARLFFIGTWNFADDRGNLAYSTKKLKMQIFPGEENIDCQALIDELLSNRVLREYEVEGKQYLHISGFREHQVINRPSKSAIPSPSWEQELPESPAPDGADDGKEKSTPPPNHDDSLRTHGALHDGREGNGEGIDKNKPPIPPKGGERPTRKRETRPLQAFLDECKATGEKPIPDEDPIFPYAEEVGVPHDFLRLHWRWFVERYSSPGAKKYKDWRDVFRRSVKGIWSKYWTFDGNNACVLTATGKQAKNGDRKTA